ncbi:hypothetical protein MLD38_030195 [Melastoma candidum]|uniref:Uncharacterized protein n=1 Tax=Melastoma candidum TaxID=119954 RepID=A0ACB9MM63_9MYRT|nr:hypothetical protein MLD38_030195 [Melastoma candidum]
MSSKQGGKAKPLKAPKVDKKEYDEADLAYLQKKKEEEKALKDLKSKATQKGNFGGAGLKKTSSYVKGGDPHHVGHISWNLFETINAFVWMVMHVTMCRAVNIAFADAERVPHGVTETVVGDPLDYGNE